MNPFTPLDVSKPEIRLLTIKPHKPQRRVDLSLPPNAQQPIICELMTTTLSPDMNYEYLSYEWGQERQEGESFPIFVNGKVVQARENLWWALFYMRQETTWRVLWVDALCINQQDLKEQNHQVSQLKSIIQNAKHTVLWIGRELTESKHEASNREVFDTIKEFRNETRRYCDHPREWTYSERVLAGIVALVHRTYWYQAWIIQDVLLVTNKTICCGPHTLPWTEFAQLIKDPDRIRCPSHHRTKYYVHGIRSSMPSKLIAAAKLKQNPASALDLLSRFPHGKCEIMIEKLFGIHSLARPCCQQAVPIDYSNTPATSLETIIRHHCAEHKDEKTPLYSVPRIAKSFGLGLRHGMFFSNVVYRGLCLSNWNVSAHWQFMFNTGKLEPLTKDMDNFLESSQLKKLRAKATEETTSCRPLFDSKGQEIDGPMLRVLREELDGGNKATKENEYPQKSNRCSTSKSSMDDTASSSAETGKVKSATARGRSTCSVELINCSDSRT